jgi:hypothetical protein
MSTTGTLRGALVAATLLALAGAAHADSGATLTPNLRNYMVNKDIQAQRWTINLNVSSDDPTSIINVTGNIFRSDGGPPSFVLCQVRPDSTGTLNDPSSTFRLTCAGTDACQTNASDCARDTWTQISDDVEIAASFFLPPAGLGAAAGSTTAAPSLGARARGLLQSAWSGLRDLVAQAAGLATPSSAIAQASNRGATLSLDKLNFLVNKDVGNERWSISLNFVPQQSQQGGIVPQLQSLTGNVFKPDGSPPSFIFCTPRDDSTGTLDDPSSQFGFSCQGTNACAGDARDCARTSWSLISDDVVLSSSFFLPPGGLPAATQSDPGIVIIGRTSDPPSIVTTNFSTTQGASAARPAAGCNEGAECFVPTLGSCKNVRGKIVTTSGGACGCLIENVSTQCIGCGGGAAGQCGGDCSFPVAGATARGECLPFSPGSATCACYAIASGQDQSVQGCAGPDNVGCSGARCCVDDPRDGCDPLHGGAGCLGICVSTASCESGGQQCGSCLSPSGQFCGDGRRQGSEQCDGSDFGGQDCSSFGFSGGGSLSCSSSCQIDSSGCSASTNTPPEIVSIDFPSVIDPFGGPVEGSISFEDQEGDIVKVSFDQVEGNFTPVSFDPGVFGRASGSFSFFFDCQGNTGSYTISVTLEDAQGNDSQPALLQTTCESAAVCGDGRIEGGEVCDPPGQSGGCGSGLLCTSDCSQCLPASSCEGRCCPGSTDVCAPPNATCACDDGCVVREDCCRDWGALCG